MIKVKVTVTTDGSGDAVAYSPRIAGKIHSVSYVKPGANAYADGVDFAITSEATGEQIWAESNVNATAYRYPRAATHSNAGVASLFAASGTAVQDKIALATDRIKIVVAQGGAAKVGAFHFCIDC